ncbi:hypothetical protein EMCRGX_G019178 [Ephydatia muelleri]|eukprot:Em0011g828a
MAVRVRFAPSPTGGLHLGGARTALYNYLFAKANNGRCLLRIEDTDTERNVPGSAQQLQESLEWLGVRFDEGPNIGGKFGPYIQSERLKHYQQYSRQLVQEQHSAYCCFCTAERLQSLRSQGWATGGYDRRCRTLSIKQVSEYLQMGLPHTIRLKTPEDGVTTVVDQIYGEVHVPNDTVDDQILMKSDGYPTYHFANVVDDHLMEISHVFRGEEWLLSTVKHLALYKAFGWEPPTFAHLPLLRSSTGEKLSKRKHNAHLEHYRERGFLPEALVNFLALLGWSPKSGQEYFTMDELVQSFSLEGVSKRGVAVDEAKLEWMNGLHFKKKCQSERGRQELVQGLQKCLKESGCHVESRTTSDSYLEQVLQLLEGRISLLPKIPSEASYFWRDPVPNREGLCVINNAAQILGTIATKLDRCEDSREAMHTALKSAAAEARVPYSLLMLQCRLAITGTKNSPGLVSIMATIGKEVSQRRLQTAISLCE